MDGWMDGLCDWLMAVIWQLKNISHLHFNDATCERARTKDWYWSIYCRSKCFWYAAFIVTFYCTKILILVHDVLCMLAFMCFILKFYTMHWKYSVVLWLFVLQMKLCTSCYRDICQSMNCCRNMTCFSLPTLHGLSGNTVINSIP